MRTCEDVLKHFGILGMKWGRKKGKKITTPVIKKVVKDPKDMTDREYLDAHKGKPLSELSNDQITRINNRINLERQYAQLTKVEMSAGKKFVVDMLTNIAKEQAQAFVKKKVADMITARTARAITRP